MTEKVFLHGRRNRAPQLPEDDLAGYAPEERVVIRAAQEALEEKLAVLQLKLENGDISQGEFLAEINKIREGLNLPPLL